MDQQQPQLITDRAITIKDFSKICRFCMSRCDILETIFKEDTYSTEQTITTMFAECLHLDLDIDPNAELPLCICLECIEKLVNCYNFRKQCVNSYNRLTEIWKNEQNASESPSHDDDNVHMDVEKIFCLEPKIKEENSDDENEEVQTVVSDISTSRVQFSGDGEPLNDSTDNIQGTNVKKKVGRPKKPIEEKVVKAPGMCQICGGLYVGLKYHMFVHEVPKFECDYCGRKFKHKSNLFAHVRIHANDRKHQCPHCPYKFQDRAKYLRHLKIHTGERNISCDICGKSFCRKTDMLKHRLIHDVPRVPCPYCDKMFTTKTNMLSHIGIHTGERNFKCETCGAAFTASSSLSNHRKIHKKENPVIKCKECGIVLADTAMLKNHMRDHQNIVMLESFKDSDGDGIGDIQGIISKLGHLKEMGVDGTWLSPIFVSPMKDFGYDISDYYAIQPEYGTMDDAVELFAKAKEVNIRIVLDFVPNHTSDQCTWFKLSAANDPVYRDYYVWHEGIEENGVRKPPNNWNSVFYGSAWTWNDQRQAFYLHQFDKSQPDLNFRHQAVVDEMKNVLRFWLDKGASGFRVDAVSHLVEDAELCDEPIDNSNDPLAYDYTRKDYTKDLDETFDMLYQWRDVMDDYQKRHEGETRILMSEAYGNDTIFKKYYQSADGLRQGSHMPFNFVLVSDVNINSTAADFKRVIDNRLEIVPESKKTNWVMGNHDHPRMASRFGSQMVDALLTLLMTLPGMSVAYNGEEIGMEDFRFGITFDETLDPAALNAYPEGPRDGWQWKSRDPERTPFQWDDTKNAGFCNCTGKPWLPVNDNYPKLNLAHQKASSKSKFRYYKELAQLRKDETMKSGDYKSFVHNDVFGYTRTLSNYEPRLILMNLGKTKQMVRVSQFTSSFDNKLRVMVAGAETPYKKGDIIDANRVRLPKYSVIVVENLIERRANTIGSLLATILKYLQTINNKLEHLNAMQVRMNGN